MIGGFLLKNKKDNANHKYGKFKKEIKRNRGKNVFDSSRIAELPDDPVGVLGWKGTGVLVIVIVLGFIIFKLFFY
jgi:hypothetical protein